jgi:two-component system, sensor histidine kinase
MFNFLTKALTAHDFERYRDRIRTELIVSVCARLASIVLIETMVATFMIVMLLWEVATPLRMAVWLVIHFALVLAHGYIYLKFRIDGLAAVSRLPLYLRLSFLLIGVYWAVLLAYMFVLTPDLLYHLYLYLFAGAVGILALAMLSEDLPTFMGVAVPPFVVLTIQCVIAWHPKYITLALLGMLCAVGLGLFARTKQRGAAESVALRCAITDLAAELRDQRDAAQRANVAKSKFLAAASHDLRQPLHALTLLATALRDSAIDSRARSIANDMSGAIGSLDKMFGALLDISKLDAGVLHPVAMHFDAGALLRRMNDEFALLAQAKGLNLLCQASEMAVHADPILLERIVRNYVANAVRYTHAGTIRISCQSTHRGVRIEVADTGIGISPAEQAQIFDEFYQVNNPERDRSKGLGLGLAIVRRIAELLDLDYGVESVVTQGTTFYVLVPHGDLARSMPTDPIHSASRQKLSGLRVLVIDDDLAVRDSMRTLLTAWDCEVAIASDAEQALVVARAAFAVPDVMVVDYRLRDERTGVEAIAQVRAAFKVEIPALIVSGDTAPERLREVAASGHTLIHKPAQPAALRAFLLSALRAKR